MHSQKGEPQHNLLAREIRIEIDEKMSFAYQVIGREQKDSVRRSQKGNTPEGKGKGGDQKEGK